MTPNTHTEVPPEAEEALAALLYEDERTYSQPTWDAPEPPSGRGYLTPERREIWRRRARRHLRTALPSLHSAWERELRERLEKLERFDPEHDESRRQDFALGNDPIVMEPYGDGDWLRREDVLAALQKGDK